MKVNLQIHPSIDLQGDGTRISAIDAKRQELTAKELLDRMNLQPGLILADEVGMGKTFVALAVATSVAIENQNQGPVVIMVPPNILKKWEQDFDNFKKYCIKDEKLRDKIKRGSAEDPVSFLKFLDDPKSRRKSIVFLSHSGMHRKLGDEYVKLALLRQAICHKTWENPVRRSVYRYIDNLVRASWFGKGNKELLHKLLGSQPKDWTNILINYGVLDSEADDVIPEALLEILPDLDLSSIYEAISDIPKKKGSHFEVKIKEIKGALEESVRESWKHALKEMDLDLPLLIFDEAHHLKNDNKGNLALFGSKESQELADDAEKGSLAQVFSRMLFLTATPFQLGHHELCGVLRRFNGIKWKSIDTKRDDYVKQIDQLHGVLDQSHLKTVELQNLWGMLDDSDLVVDGIQYENVNDWWQELKSKSNPKLTGLAENVLKNYQEAERYLLKAQELLKPWVIRHTKNKRLVRSSKKRREIWVGKQANPGGESESPQGIPVASEGLAPFLLASRAATFTGSGRSIYVEGLCSTFETFKHTRRNKEEALDTDDSAEVVELSSEASRLNWYLDNIEKILPDNKFESSMNHPKVKATVERTFDLWLKGEKVLIFCFYKETGKTLRNLISQRISQYIQEEGSKVLKCKPDEVEELLKKASQRLEKDEAFAVELSKEVHKMLMDFPNLQAYEDDIQKIVRFFLKSDASLIRYVPLDKVFDTKKGDYSEVISDIFSNTDSSNLSFNKVLINFFVYIDRKIGDCSEEDAQDMLKAMSQAQLPTRAKTEQIFGEEPEGILPNVKKAAGDLDGNQKHNVMVTFNTPFLPDILVASSVMSEGMDLHLNCRHIIHHDLCWNPSNLEQRTGRIDRIGAKAEVAEQSIQVYYPYIAATQDEKMFKVVMDREQWFKVIMGEKVKMDQATIEREAARIPFPKEAAEKLQFKLNVA